MKINNKPKWVAAAVLSTGLLAGASTVQAHAATTFKVQFADSGVQGPRCLAVLDLPTRTTQNVTVGTEDGPASHVLLPELTFTERANLILTEYTGPTCSGEIFKQFGPIAFDHDDFINMREH